MHRNPLLLCLSKAPELLGSRQRVLATRYDVVSIKSLEEMERLPSGSVFDLLVLCHTFSEDECKRVTHVARQRWPRIKILSLITQSAGCSEQDSDLSVVALDGPGAMFAGISRLLPAYRDELAYKPLNNREMIG